MKLIQSIVCLPLLAALLTACQRDNVDDVKFEVTTEDVKVQVNQNVHFAFQGNPDYVVFYPGTKTCAYENRERTELSALSALDLSCKIEQVYTEVKAYKGQTLLKAYISTDFSGVYSKESIAAATWTEIPGLQMPVSDKANVTIDQTKTSLYDYLDQDFYVAFKYEAGPNQFESNYSKPRIQIKLLTLNKVDTDGYAYPMTDVANDWGFRCVPVKTLPAALNYQVTESMITFFPDAAEKENDVEVWMISRKIQAKSVEPDRGMPIKSTNARLPYYDYRYSKPGTYKATFVATNAMMWDASQTVRELTIEVTE